jgi:hypothetical protein
MGRLFIKLYLILLGTVLATFVSTTQLYCFSPAGVAGVSVSVTVTENGSPIFVAGPNSYYYLGACVNVTCGNGTCSLGAVRTKHCMLLIVFSAIASTVL